MKNKYLYAAAAVVILSCLVIFLPVSLGRGLLALIDYVIVPGFIAGQILAPEWPVWLRAALGLLIGVVLAPFLLIVLARAHGTLTITHVALLFSVLSLLGLAWLWRRSLKSV